MFDSLDRPRFLVNWLEPYQPAEIAKLQHEDSDPVEAELYLQSLSTKYFWKFKNQLQNINGILYYNWQGKIDRACYVVPSSLKKEVLSFCHHSRWTGHFALEKTLSRLKSSFFWYQMKTDCDVYIKNCRACSIHKKLNNTAWSPLKRYHAGYPMDRVHLDVLGPFAPSESGDDDISIQ